MRIEGVKCRKMRKIIMTEIQMIKELEDKIVLIQMKSEEVDMVVSNLGCHIISIKTSNKQGKMENICLGYGNVMDCLKDNACYGAIVGRVANRIGHGRFELNGKSYEVAKNCGIHHLHGGENGFDRKIFTYDIEDNAIIFTYTSPDGEEGYPGQLDVKITYTLEGNQFVIDYEMSSDQDTIVNLTNHAYFNLSGEAMNAGHGGAVGENGTIGVGNNVRAFNEDVHNHYLKIRADRYACVNDTGLVYGEIKEVKDTPFDFTSACQIGQRIYDDHEQLKNAGGYDHPFVLNDRNEMEDAVLFHEGSGRRVSMKTTYPTIQVYTGNYLAGGVPGLHSLPYENRDGVALEAQYLSNSIQVEKEPRVILRKGEIRREKTEYRFDIG